MSKTEYFAKKDGKKKATKRVLFEMIDVLGDIGELEDDSSPCEVVKAFFGDFVETGTEATDNYSDEDEIRKVIHQFTHGTEASRC